MESMMKIIRRELKAKKDSYETQKKKLDKLKEDIEALEKTLQFTCKRKEESTSNEADKLNYFNSNKKQKTEMKKQEQSHSSRIIPIGRVSSPASSMAHIKTTSQIKELQKPTLRKYTDYINILSNYQEEDKSLCFYPIQRQTIGVKAIVMQGASASATYDLFSLGLIDCMYVTDTKQLSMFPKKFQQSVKFYIERFAKGKEVYLKHYSTPAVFGSRGEEVIKSYSAIQIGVSNQDHPCIDDEVTKPEEDPESIKKRFISSYLGLVYHLENVGAKIRLNDKSDSCLIYSKCRDVIKEAGFEAFDEFRMMLQCLQVQVPEEYQHELCRKLQAFSAHVCKHCDTSSKMKNARVKM